VAVRQGETYRIRVENATEQPVMMRLLVDGLNTLPEKEADKGLVTHVWGKRVNLNEARPWVLDRKGKFRIDGFATRTGVKGEWKEFTVVDGEKSLAAKQQFTDQIGIITAGFYEIKGNPRGLGTDAGAQVEVDLLARQGIEIGNLLAVVHIHYVDADELKELAKE
jgi:hypothetical protein